MASPGWVVGQASQAGQEHDQVSQPVEAVQAARRPTRLIPRTATWAVAGFLAIALAVGIVLLVPPALYPSLRTPDADLVGLKAQERFDIETARLELQAGLRQTLIQSLAVLVTVSGALLAWRQSLHERQQKRDDFNLKLFGEARSNLSTNQKPSGSVASIHWKHWLTAPLTTEGQ